jgi:uncharacterized protein (DUF305 family)
LYAVTRIEASEVSARLMGAVAFLAIVVVSCRATPSQPAPAPVASAQAQPTPAAASKDSVPTRYTDVQFMQGMIAHHAQALEMTALIPTRTSREDFRLLGQRIDISQKDEIAMMRRWLREHGAQAPSLDAHNMHHDAAGQMMLMPGMLTHEELAQLEQSTGVEFERLFLRYMIRHHQGALAMVSDLLGTKGSAQDPLIFNYASDIDADQRAEIRRMQTLQRDIK